MRRLILMRHAKSSWDDPSMDDHDRPLTKRGRDSAQAMGDWLRHRGYEADTVLCSTAQRTGETCLGLSVNAPVAYERALYHTNAGALLTRLQACEAQCVLLIGHNPGMAECAYRLVATAPTHPRFVDYPTCATLVADFDITGWHDLRWGLGTAVDFAVPREVMR